MSNRNAGAWKHEKCATDPVGTAEIRMLWTPSKLPNLEVGSFIDLPGCVLICAHK